MAWVLRGLRDGVVPTRYPRRPDGYGDGFLGAVSVVTPARPSPVDLPVARGDEGGRPGDGEGLTALCPTGAILVGDGVQVDRGRCILCGRCAQARPDRFAIDPAVEVAKLERRLLIVPPEDDHALEDARAELGRRVRALRRSIHIRHVDAGSDGAEEWEVVALTNPIYDVQRLGVFFTASPRHADLLLVTGVGTAGMAGPLRHTFEAMPEPKIVLAAGADAISGGLLRPSYAGAEGVGAIVPVDIWVPGSPPSPFSLLHGILLGIGLLTEGVRTR